MITLYHAPRSRSSRIVWLLEEIGTPYEIQPVSIFRPLTGQGVPDPANPHPNARVPAIVHDGDLVTESVAITLYLTDAFPAARLGPAVGEAGRGAYLSWLAWYAGEFEPAMFYAMLRELDAAPNKQRLYDQAFQRLTGALTQHPFVLGDRFSGADLLIASALNFGRAAFPDSAVFDDYARRCRERPAAIRATTLDDAIGLQQAA